MARRGHEVELQGVVIRAATAADIPAWSSLRAALWPEGSSEEHASELPDWLAEAGACSRVAEAPDGRLVGFLEGRLRSHADGCATSPVGYLEGWFVDRGWRRRGIGSALVAAFEAWARERGCREMASDTWPENEASIEAHKRLGFLEVDCVVTFRKPLDERVARPASLPAAVRPPARWEVPS